MAGLGSWFVPCTNDFIVATIWLDRDEPRRRIRNPQVRVTTVVEQFVEPTQSCRKFNFPATVFGRHFHCAPIKPPCSHDLAGLPPTKPMNAALFDGNTFAECAQLQVGHCPMQTAILLMPPEPAREQFKLRSTEMAAQTVDPQQRQHSNPLGFSGFRADQDRTHFYLPPCANAFLRSGRQYKHNSCLWQPKSETAPEPDPERSGRRPRTTEQLMVCR